MQSTIRGANVADNFSDVSRPSCGDSRTPPRAAGSRHSKEITVAVAPRLGIALEPIPINTPEDIDSALAAMERNRPDALFVHPTPVLQVNDQAVIAFAVKQQLPTITGIGQMARDGILLSYASDHIQMWRVAADYVDRILTSAKPADLRSAMPTVAASSA